jgi:hypothetical protein
MTPTIQKDEASWQVGGLPATDIQRYAQGKQAHRRIEGAPDGVAEALARAGHWMLRA